MTLHVFNPEHDIALASNLPNFTAPRAARGLRSDLGYIPVLWAEDGDAVLVDDAAYAERQMEDLSKSLDVVLPNVRFVTKALLRNLKLSSISPWGWDKTLCCELCRNGVSAGLCLSQSELAIIRALSHRELGAKLLAELRVEGTVGESVVCHDEDDVIRYLEDHKQIVAKAPWSSSGRGVRMVRIGDYESKLKGWVKNMLKQQGALVAEPYYNKVKDFGMEFFSDGNGTLIFCGLSLFRTEQSAYAGSIIAPEQVKQSLISRYISVDLLKDIKGKIQVVLAQWLKGKYKGPLGVDMMIVKDYLAGGYFLHPCVEVNLRRTMGHVALSLSSIVADAKMVMQIETDNVFKLKIQML